MKILIDNGGQTCNKFWGYLFPLTNAILYGKKYIVPIYDETIDYYPNLRSNSYFYYPFYSKIINRLFGIREYISFLERILRLCRCDYDHLKKKWPHILLDSWSTRVYQLDKRAKDEIKRIFLPTKEIVNKTEELFSSHRHNHNLIIGVHIRRGDYKNWRNGTYYYSFEQYVSICKRLVDIYKDNKIIFFISTNERIDHSSFSGIDYFVNPCNSAVADLYSLSLCDLIVGPPSSFSRFASYYGDVPISFILDIHNHLFNFRTIENYNTYCNGDKVEFDF